MVGVGEPDASDVVGGAVGEVEPAEGETLLDGVQLGEAVLVEGGEGVALGAVLRGPGRPAAACASQPLGGLRPQHVEPGVLAVDGCLLLAEVFGPHTAPFFPVAPATGRPLSALAGACVVDACRADVLAVSDPRRADQGRRP